MSTLDPDFIERQRTTYRASWPLLKRYKAHLIRQDLKSLRSRFEDFYSGNGYPEPEEFYRRMGYELAADTVITDNISTAVLFVIEVRYTVWSHSHSSWVAEIC